MFIQGYRFLIYRYQIHPIHILQQFAVIYIVHGPLFCYILIR